MPTIIGSGTGIGSKFGQEAVIDQLRGAFRTSISPLDHSDINGNLLGFYKAGQVSGATVSLGAAGHLASLRWTDTSRFLALLRVKVGWSVTGAITAATPMDVQAVVARGFSVDFTTASTQLSLAAVSNTNKMRANMGTSLMGALGPRIATTTVMSGQTLTADASPFAYMVYPNQPSGNATVTQAIGVSGPMSTLYEWDINGGHPLILSANEGVIIQPVTAGPVTGTVKYYVSWEWAELAYF
jgi:hypothetical protein